MLAEAASKMETLQGDNDAKAEQVRLSLYIYIRYIYRYTESSAMLAEAASKMEALREANDAKEQQVYIYIYIDIYRYICIYIYTDIQSRPQCWRRRPPRWRRCRRTMMQRTSRFIYIYIYVYLFIFIYRYTDINIYIYICIYIYIYIYI